MVPRSLDAPTTATARGRRIGSSAPVGSVI
jgi:hypothetical protein